eukprot:COSAG01_NODE_32065_length_587_cov_0.450820_1_plen_82_part_00
MRSEEAGSHGSDAEADKEATLRRASVASEADEGGEQGQQLDEGPEEAPAVSERAEPAPEAMLTTEETEEPAGETQRLVEEV